MITPGNGMKWYATEPQQGVFEWTNGDRIVDLARAHHQKVRAPTPSSGTASCPTGSPRGSGRPANCGPC
jgi:Glycosyl hydrolase family 10